jgi:hypothetical protein
VNLTIEWQCQQIGCSNGVTLKLDYIIDAEDVDAMLRRAARAVGFKSFKRKLMCPTCHEAQVTF